jgi:hypothetical protein
VLLSLFKNYSTISLGGGADLFNQTVTNATHGAISSRSFPVRNATDVDCFLLNVRFNHVSHTNTAAIIRKIDVHYQPTQKT